MMPPIRDEPDYDHAARDGRKRVSKEFLDARTNRKNGTHVFEYIT